LPQRAACHSINPFDTILGVSPSTATVASSPKLLDRVRWHLRVKHYSIRTEQAYVDWIRRYILFHRKRHPNEMNKPGLADFWRSTYLSGNNRHTQFWRDRVFAWSFYLFSKRNLWPAIIRHALVDTIFFALVYLGLDTKLFT
jgi:Phage integrase, N-terminal SAM-like domain